MASICHVLLLAFICLNVLAHQKSSGTIRFDQLEKYLYLAGESIRFSLVNDSSTSELATSDKPIFVSLMKKRPFYLPDKQIAVVELAPNQFHGNIEMPERVHTGYYYMRAYVKKWPFGIKMQVLAKSNFFGVQSTGLLVSPAWSRLSTLVNVQLISLSSKVRLTFTSKWNAERLKNTSIEIIEPRSSEIILTIDDLSQYHIEAREDRSFVLDVPINDIVRLMEFHKAFIEAVYKDRGIIFRSGYYPIYRPANSVDIIALQNDVKDMQCDHGCSKCERIRKLIRQTPLNFFSTNEQMKTMCFDCISERMQDKFVPPSPFSPDYYTAKDIPSICKAIIQYKFQ